MLKIGQMDRLYSRHSIKKVDNIFSLRGATAHPQLEVIARIEISVQMPSQLIPKLDHYLSWSS